MNIELNELQANLLHQVLRTRVDQLERELIHTDNREFRRELRGTIDSLEQLLAKLHLRTESQDAYA